ncbi:hypothetical protein [Hymenobacter edaphi]|uniref:Uncharacterized protein n=1 Tax=Hymenobacter edaphi TaxID=2211146 RepID=A0A328BJI2_9BACT|nr:hypothetical protein [Hymenobacter edaphi]RAK65128.1 hypothetical protein DLM85_16445 [Hymenobacter edaphi]
MKQLLLLLGLLTGLAAQAAEKPRRPAVAAPRPAADSVQQRAACRTRYLTDVLHLSSRQALAVRRCAYEQAAAVATAPARQRFDEQMLRILTPGQYSAFVWLAESLSH